MAHASGVYSLHEYQKPCRCREGDLGCSEWLIPFKPTFQPFILDLGGCFPLDEHPAQDDHSDILRSEASNLAQPFSAVSPPPSSFAEESGRGDSQLDKGPQQNFETPVSDETNGQQGSPSGLHSELDPAGDVRDLEGHCNQQATAEAELCIENWIELEPQEPAGSPTGIEACNSRPFDGPAMPIYDDGEAHRSSRLPADEASTGSIDVHADAGPHVESPITIEFQGGDDRPSTETRHSTAKSQEGGQDISALLLGPTPGPPCHGLDGLTQIAPPGCIHAKRFKVHHLPRKMMQTYKVL